MKAVRLVSLLLSLLAAQLAVAADAGTLRMASLEWMPFVGAGLPQDGISGAIVSEVTRQMVRSLKVDYFSWQDAVKKGESDPAYSGYFPVFYTEERAQEKCHLSAPLGRSTTGLAYLKDAPFQWSALPDLAGMKIGVVEGYSNGKAFDAAIKQGKQAFELSPSDTISIRKLVTKKVPAIVVDKLVLRFLLLKSPARDSIVFHEHTLADQTLHVCFRRTPEGKGMQEAFDAALKKVDVAKFEREYFKRLEAQSK